MPYSIMIIDEDRNIADLIETFLINENFNVIKFVTAEDALLYAQEEEVDLAIVDASLPDMDGFVLCKKIRERYIYPIIILSENDAEREKITGFASGADDYITKPFKSLELVARVKAHLRRYKTYIPPYAEADSGTIMRYKLLKINTDSFECFLGNKRVDLTPTEFSIVRTLLEHPGKVLSAEDLFREIWKDEFFTKNSSSITVHIRHIRKKLHDTGLKPSYIKTVWGVGYKI